MEFHKNLYELRKQKGFSQEELAEKINVSRQTISKWEIGSSTPEMEKLIMLSEVFEISLDQLVLGNETLSDRLIIKKGTKNTVKICMIVLSVVFIIDFLSMVIYFILNGAP